MIASPGDVASERAIVRDVVYEWNAVNSQTRKIVLLPIGWESHSSPEMGDSPQDIINRQVLSKCDLLVGVFWTRIGTATAGFESGTVEEIEKHIASGKPAMLYFSSQPVALDMVDIGQVAKLKGFKESCKTRGLFESYDSLADFKERFYRHLQLKTNEHPLFQSVSSSPPGNPILESQTPLPTLSTEARVLLKEAAADPNGTILKPRSLSGPVFLVGGRNFTEGAERREVAKWEEGLTQLVDRQLVRPRGSKGELFELTNVGYQVADMIQL